MIVPLKDAVQLVFLFMDNDKAGFLATHALAKELIPNGFDIGSRSNLYEGYKDVSEWNGGIKAKNIIN